MERTVIRIEKISNNKWQIDSLELDEYGYPLATIEFHGPWTEKLTDGQRRGLITKLVEEADEWGLL